MDSDQVLTFKQTPSDDEVAAKWELIEFAVFVTENYREILWLKHKSCGDIISKEMILV